MPHPLALQLRFARAEFVRGLAGITDEDARHRFLPMNSISWNIGHLASQEQRNWLTRAQGRRPFRCFRICLGTGDKPQHRHSTKFGLLGTTSCPWSIATLIPSRQIDFNSRCCTRDSRVSIRLELFSSDTSITIGITSANAWQFANS